MSLPAGPGGTATAVASPCVNVCRIDEITGWCQGCLRTLDEIACWSLLDDADKRAVIAAVLQRREPGPVPRPGPEGDAP